MPRAPSTPSRIMLWIRAHHSPVGEAHAPTPLEGIRAQRTPLGGLGGHTGLGWVATGLGHRDFSPKRLNVLVVCASSLPARWLRQGRPRAGRHFTRRAL